MRAPPRGYVLEPVRAGVFSHETSLLHLRNEVPVPGRTASRRPGARGERHIRGGPVGKIRSSEPGAGGFDEQFDGHGQRGAVTPAGVPGARTRLLRTRGDFPGSFTVGGMSIARVRGSFTFGLHGTVARRAGGRRSRLFSRRILPPRPATAGCRQRPPPNGLNSRTSTQGSGGQPVRVASGSRHDRTAPCTARDRVALRTVAQDAGRPPSRLRGRSPRTACCPCVRRHGRTPPATTRRAAAPSCPPDSGAVRGASRSP